MGTHLPVTERWHLIIHSGFITSFQKRRVHILISPGAASGKASKEANPVPMAPYPQVQTSAGPLLQALAELFVNKLMGESPDAK